MASRFQFWHQRLDVYQKAVRFVQYVSVCEGKWFRGRADRGSQLKRAADSIPLNVAEGCGRASVAARKNHYRIAMGSAAECDAVLHLLEVEGRDVSEGRRLLSDIGAMLWGMMR